MPTKKHLGDHLFAGNSTILELLQLGGKTSSFPALKRSGTQVDVRLADDSAYASLRASQLSSEASLYVGRAGGTANIIFGTGSPITTLNQIRSQVTGSLALLNGDGNDFGLLQFGGTSSAFPSLKRDSADLRVRLADDSADAVLYASELYADSIWDQAGTWGFDSSGEAYFENVYLGDVGNGQLAFLNGTYLDGTATSGNMLLADSANAAMLLFGGETSSFPALKRNTTELHARLADDSAFANISGLSPTLGDHLTTKLYVDNLIAGLDWQNSVLDKDLTAPPGGESIGDRYIVAATATGAWVGEEEKIAEWNGTSWDFTTPNKGYACLVEDENTQYTYNDAHPAGSWVLFNTSMGSHALGGSNHTADTLANLNSKISDATLVDTGDSRFSDDRTASGIRTATTIVSVSGATAPTIGQVLKATSGTNATWQDDDVVAPGGLDTHVQFNDGGSTFGGDAGLRYDKTNGALLVGSAAALVDVPYARAIVSQADTGTVGFTAYNVGFFTEAAASAGLRNAVALGAKGITDGSQSVFVVRAEAGVTSSADTGGSTAAYFGSAETHAGGNNQGIVLNAIGGANNYALRINNGDVYTKGGDLDWLISDNQASALSFDSTAAAGILDITTTTAAEGVTFNHGLWSPGGSAGSFKAGVGASIDANSGVSVAIGNGPTIVYSVGGVAIGDGALITGTVTNHSNGAVVIGDGASAESDAEGAVVIGQGALAFETGAVNLIGSIAIGKDSQVGCENAVVIGEGASTAGGEDVVIGQAAFGGIGGSNVVIGDVATLTDDSGTLASVVIGAAAEVTAGSFWEDTVVGYNASVSVEAATAIGANANVDANSANSVALGYSANVDYAVGGIAIGDGSSIGGTVTYPSTGAVVIGDGAVVDQRSTYSVVIGAGAKTDDGGTGVLTGSSVAIGRAAIVYGGEAVAIGDNARANGLASIAIGNGAQANANSIAVGPNSDASYSTGEGRIVINPDNNEISYAYGVGTIIIGADSSDYDQGTSDNSVFIGHGMQYNNAGRTGSNWGGGLRSVAIGYQAFIGLGADGSVAIGDNPEIGAASSYAIAIGRNATVDDQSSTAVAIGGDGTTITQIAYAVGGLALGASARINGTVTYPSTGAVVVGDGAYASQRSVNSVVIGAGANTYDSGGTTRSERSVVIGATARSEYSDNVVIGPSTYSAGGGDVIIGDTALGGDGGYNVAIGNAAEIESSSFNCVAIGDSAVAETGIYQALAFGDYAAVSSIGATAFGSSTQVNAGSDYGLAAGYGARVYTNSDYGISLGTNSRVGSTTGTSPNSTAIGYNAYVYAGTTNAIAMGTNSAVRDGGTGSIAIGNAAKAGTTATGGATDGIAIGSSATLSDGAIQSIVIGAASTVSEVQSIVIGHNSSIAAGATNSLVFGDASTVGAGALAGIAIGVSADVLADADFSIAIGRSTSVGVGALSTVVIGDSASTVGIVATGSLTVVAASQLAAGVDTDTFVLNDGVNPAVTFIFDDDSSVTETATTRAVPHTGVESASAVRDLVITAITNAPTLDITASIGGTAIVSLVNDTVGAAGNVNITETVADTGFLKTGMSGGRNDSVTARSVVIGHDALANGLGSVAIGDAALARGASGDVIIGDAASSALASSNVVVIGKNASTDEGNAVAVGASAKANEGCVAIGSYADASYQTVNEGVLIGYGSNLYAPGSVVIGYGASDWDIGISDNSVVIGYSAESRGLESVAIGNDISVNSADHSVGIGSDVAIDTSSDESVVLGYLAAASTSAGGVSIGANAAVNEDYAMSIGYSSVVASTHTYSVALGYDAATTAANQFMLGTATNPLHIYSHGYQAMAELASPPSGAETGFGRFYVKSSDGNPYFLDSAGAETQLNSITVPGGSDTQVQYNDGGTAFGGMAGVTWNDATGDFTIAAAGKFRPTGAGGLTTVAIGNASAIQAGSVAIGDSSAVWDGSTNSVALGYLAKVGTTAAANIVSGVAIGAGATLNDGSTNSIAIGGSSTITGIQSLVLGFNASVGCDSAVVIGSAASVGAGSGTDAGNIAVGTSSAVGINTREATAVGPNSDVGEGADYSVALGHDATVAAAAVQSIAIGSAATVNPTQAIAVGYNAAIDANSASAVAIGNAPVVSYSVGGISIGDAAQVNGTVGTPSTGAIALGDGATVGTNSLYSIAVGFGSTVRPNSTETIVIGEGSNAGTTVAGNVDLGIIVGTQSTIGDGTSSAIILGATSVIGAGSDNGISIGINADIGTSIDNVIVIGANTGVDSTRSTLVGSYADIDANSADAVSIGTTSSVAYALGGIAIGSDASVGGTIGTPSTGAIALGDTALVSTNSIGAISIGASASASQANNISLGASVVTAGLNQIAIGNNISIPSNEPNVVAIAPGITGATFIGNDSVYIGTDMTLSVDDSRSSVIIGDGITTQADGGVAIGQGADLIEGGLGGGGAGDSIAIGRVSRAEGWYNMAIGVSAYVDDDASGNYYGSMAVGPNNCHVDQAQDATALGTASHIGVAANFSTAIGGATVVAAATYAIGIGSGSSVTGTDAIAFGHSATVGTASGTAIAIGSDSSTATSIVYSVGGIALGASAQIAGTVTYPSTGAISIGDAAVVGSRAVGSVAIGAGAQVNGTDTRGSLGAVSIGYGAIAGDYTNDTIVIGSGAQANPLDQATQTTSNVIIGADVVLHRGKENVLIGQAITNPDVDQRYNVGVGALIAMPNGDENTFVGEYITASGTGAYNTVVGGESQIGNNVYDATLIGYDNTAGPDTNYVVGIGDTHNLNAHNAIGIGEAVYSDGEHSIAIGSSNNIDANSDGAISIGSHATVENRVDYSVGGIALGVSARINGTVGTPSTGSIAIGDTAAVSTSSIEAVAIGKNTTASGNYAIALGGNAQGSAVGAIALGANADTRGVGGIALGQDAIAAFDDDIAIGHGAQSFGDVTNNSVTIGWNAYSWKDESITIGQEAENMYAESIVVGRRATSNSQEGTVFGWSADVSSNAEGAIAIGASARAGATDGTSATGTITTVAGSVLADTDSFTIPGIYNNVTFQFDSDGSVVESDTLRAVNYTTGDTADTVRDSVIAAVNATPRIAMTASNNGAASVALTHIEKTTAANLTITESVANTGFAVSGMSGGVNPTISDYAICIGRGSDAYNLHAIALGYNAQATATYSTSLGSAANASHSDAVAIGRNAVSTAVNRCTIGTIAGSYDKELQVGKGFAAWGSTPPAAQPTYTVTNDTTDRTYNANATTIDELADVLATLIADLQATGLLG